MMSDFSEISQVEAFLKKSPTKKALMDWAILHRERTVEFLLEDAENYQQVCGARGAIRILDRLQNVLEGGQ